jgi:hypothetical protein
MIVQQLAFENANKYCREALHPHRRSVSIQEVIRICSDVGAHHIQGAALTAAIKEIIYPSEKGGKGACFTCRQSEHFAKECHTGEKDSPLVGLEWCHPFLAQGPGPLEFANSAIKGDTGQMNVIPKLMLRVALYRNGETPGGIHPGPIKQ